MFLKEADDEYKAHKASLRAVENPGPANRDIPPVKSRPTFKYVDGVERLLGVPAVSTTWYLWIKFVNYHYEGEENGSIYNDGLQISILHALSEKFIM